MKNILTICVAILTAITFQKAQAQSLIDVGFGASTMDKLFTNVAYRY
jgi:hypothetical protein